MAFGSSVLRLARAAVVVSVVSAAATRWVWRFVDAAAAARLLSSGVPVAEVRVERVDLAASPRAAAALDDAARDAAVRFDGAGARVSSLDAASAVESAAAPSAALFAARFAAPVAAPFEATPDVPFAAPLDVPFAVPFAAAARAEAEGAALLAGFAVLGAFSVAAASVASTAAAASVVFRARGDAGVPLARVEAARFGAAFSTERSRSADTPVPVPSSGASSSF